MLSILDDDDDENDYCGASADEKDISELLHANAVETAIFQCILRHVPNAC